MPEQIDILRICVPAKGEVDALGVKYMLDGLLQCGSLSCPSGAQAALIGGLPHLPRTRASEVAALCSSQPVDQLWNGANTRRLDFWRSRQLDECYCDLDYADEADAHPTLTTPFPKEIQSLALKHLLNTFRD